MAPRFLLGIYGSCWKNKVRTWGKNENSRNWSLGGATILQKTRGGSGTVVEREVRQEKEKRLNRMRG
jgi:hypothetical protein